MENKYTSVGDVNQLFSYPEWGKAFLMSLYINWKEIPFRQAVPVSTKFMYKEIIFIIWAVQDPYLLKHELHVWSTIPQNIWNSFIILKIFLSIKSYDWWSWRLPSDWILSMPHIKDHNPLGTQRSFRFPDFQGKK
jgi:hypothetical protein